MEMPSGPTTFTVVFRDEERIDDDQIEYQHVEFKTDTIRCFTFDETMKSHMIQNVEHVIPNFAGVYDNE